jgi:hypothetical protein
MFDLGFTKKDLVRACWAAIAGAAVAIAYAIDTGETDWKVLGGAALAAAIVSVKNFLLADGSPLKG